MTRKGLLLCLLLCGWIVSARADLGKLDPMAKPSTRLSPGYLLALSVSVLAVEEDELCGEFLLDNEGRLQLTVGRQPIDKIALKGLTVAEAKEKIRTAIEKYFTAPLEIRVGIAHIPRIQVIIEGATFRNGVLSLPEGSRLSDALAEANYFPNADLQRIKIQRIEKDTNRTLLTVDFLPTLQGEVESRLHNPVLQNADRITIGLLPTPVEPKTIAVLGEVKRQGVIPYKPEMTVRDALREALGLLPTADPERVTIRRVKDNSVMTVNAQRALQDIPTDNLKLMPDDTVFVATRDSGLRYAVVGAVPAPNTFDFTGPVTLKQAILNAGGFKPDADRRKVLLLRNMLRDPAHAQAVTIDFERISKGEMPDVPLDPGDMVQVPVRKKSGFPLLDIGVFLLRLFIF
jgi:protein involved in polysaccharide export with SLBB domain